MHKEGNRIVYNEGLAIPALGSSFVNYHFLEAWSSVSSSFSMKDFQSGWNFVPFISHHQSLIIFNKNLGCFGAQSDVNCVMPKILLVKWFIFTLSLSVISSSVFSSMSLTSTMSSLATELGYFPQVSSVVLRLPLLND